MQVDIGVVLVVVRCLMLVVIAVTLGCYRDPTARYRPLTSIIATLAAGSSLGWAVHSILMLRYHEPHTPFAELWPAVFVLCVLIPVIRARGNVAKLLPRVKWQHHF
jgi:hypothetical protein